MTASRVDWPTIAARVPADLAADLDRLVGRGPAGRKPWADRSEVIRALLRTGLDHELGRDGAGRRGLFADTTTTPKVAARSTSRKAAIHAAPRAGTTRARCLEVIVRATALPDYGAGANGATTDDVVAALDGHPQNSIARRVTDLLQGGFVEPFLDEAGEPRTRPTRSGGRGIVWVATPAGINALRGGTR
jgi:Arc/MetJ-type ribon-helix-helix transcriptional regulator